MILFYRNTSFSKDIKIMKIQQCCKTLTRFLLLFASAYVGIHFEDRLVISVSKYKNHFNATKKENVMS